MIRTKSNVRIMSWNVQDFSTLQDQLREEIMRMKPHITVVQETGMWIDNEKDFRWPGAKILNIEAQQTTKGKRGGLEVIISPNVEYTELYRT